MTEKNHSNPELVVGNFPGRNSFCQTNVIIEPSFGIRTKMEISTKGQSPKRAVHNHSSISRNPRSFEGSRKRVPYSHIR